MTIKQEIKAINREIRRLRRERRELVFTCVCDLLNNQHQLPQHGEKG